MRRHGMLVAVGFVLMALLTGCMGLGSPASPALLKVEPAGVLDFGADKKELHVVIDNGGKRTLHWSVKVVGGDEWLSIDPTEGTNRGTITLTADRTGLTEGTYSAELIIDSNGGETTRQVTLTVGSKTPPPTGPLGKVEDLLVTGLTLPTGLLPTGPSAFGADTFDLVALHQIVRQLDTSVTVYGGGHSLYERLPVVPAALSAEYEAVFLLSWTPVDGADAYRVFVKADDGNWRTLADVAADELEYDVTEESVVFIVRGDFAVGDERTFRVQALSATADSGRVSEEDSGFIIGSAQILVPADNSTVPSSPTFAWREHPEAIAFGVYVDRGNLGDHVWHVVVDGDTTEITYPAGDSHASPVLRPGEYLWYIMAIGPELSGKTGGIAVSEMHTFTVGD